MIALVPKGLEELRAEHGQTALAMRWARDEIQEVAEADAPAATANWAEYRMRLDSATKALNEALASGQREFDVWGHFGRRRPTFSAVHNYTLEGVILKLRGDEALLNVTCTVKTPDGSKHRAIATEAVRVQDRPIRPLEWRLRYPTAFPDASPLVPGEYEVRWQAERSSGVILWKDSFAVPKQGTNCVTAD